ncbi:endonuclease domain-containing 1 protein-like [Astyanax mexicanus]|uniref:Endonuclease domain-containing 1 protein-like n=2 Tax=Astyanax mexicanus TaxID=7994 RepID=A0A8T2LQN2_ASTMX|nr:endonuclease domain-containing 1 protein-like [Astyanax mexicanus]
MLSLLLLYVLILLSSYSSLLEASVDESFRECSHFLYHQKPPQGVRQPGLHMICQRFEGVPRYATLYDPARRIPLYSAYTFKGSNGEKMGNYPWMYEPQLSSASETGNMQPFPQSGVGQRLEEGQAVLADYTDAFIYERGQLNPDQHQSMVGDKAATYTLTNVVPMTKEFLRKRWEPYLETVRQRLNNYCRGKAYVVTGITTAGLTMRRANINRVTVPKHIWSAYCCPDFDPGVPYDIRYKFPSFAAYGLNDVLDNDINEVSSKSLEMLVKREMPVDQNFQLFYGNCIQEV